MALTDNLIYSLEMDEASGNAIDAHASLDFTETSGSIDAAGGFRDFEAGDTEYFERTSSSDLQTGDIDFTVEATIEPESVINFPVVAHKGWTTGGEWVLYIRSDDSNKLWFSVSADANTVKSASGLSASTRYHIVASHSATDNELRLWVNGSAVTPVSYSGGTTANAGAAQIGAISGGGLYWDGLMRRVRFWKRALTGGEVTQLYNSGNGLAYEDLDGGGAVVGAGLLKSKKLSRLSRVG